MRVKVTGSAMLLQDLDLLEADHRARLEAAIAARAPKAERKRKSSESVRQQGDFMANWISGGQPTRVDAPLSGEVSETAASARGSDIDAAASTVSNVPSNGAGSAASSAASITAVDAVSAKSRAEEGVEGRPPPGWRSNYVASQAVADGYLLRGTSGEKYDPTAYRVEGDERYALANGQSRPTNEEAWNRPLKIDTSRHRAESNKTWRWRVPSASSVGHGNTRKSQTKAHGHYLNRARRLAVKETYDAIISSVWAEDSGSVRATFQLVEECENARSLAKLVARWAPTALDSISESDRKYGVMKFGEVKGIPVRVPMATGVAVQFGQNEKQYKRAFLQLPEWQEVSLWHWSSARPITAYSADTDESAPWDGGPIKVLPDDWCVLQGTVHELTVKKICYQNGEKFEEDKSAILKAITLLVEKQVPCKVRVLAHKLPRGATQRYIGGIGICSDKV